jgi:hypothetical protein
MPSGNLLTTSPPAGPGKGRHRRRRPARIAVVLTGLGVCLVLVIALVTSLRGEQPMPVGGPTGVSWDLEFGEDFAGDTADLLDSDAWHTGWFGDGVLTEPVNTLEAALMSRANLSVSGGRARLDVRPNADGEELDDGTTEPNLGSALNTDPEQAADGFRIGYGYVEARMQLPAGSSDEEVWPAFWLNGEKNPDDMEIDVVEGEGTDASCKFNIHYGEDGEDTVNLDDSPHRRQIVDGATTGMHTYAADIRPDGITFYYDGRAVGGYDGEVPDRPRYLMLTSTASGTMDSARSLEVDYVRAWTRD